MIVDEHQRKYKQALDNDHTLSMQYVKFLLFGGPGTGKTTTRNRLVGEYVNLAKCDTDSRLPDSTGVIDTLEAFKTDICTQSGASQSEKHTFSLINYSEQRESAASMDLRSVIQLLFQLIAQSEAPEKPGQTNPPNVSTNAASRSRDSIPIPTAKTELVDEVPDTYTKLLSVTPKKSVSSETSATPEVSSSGTCAAPKDETSTNMISAVKSKHQEKKPDPFKDVSDAFNQFEKITTSETDEGIKKVLQEMLSILINICDCGGQMFFLDMLPALTIGHALYLVFFRLDKELNESLPVTFRRGKQIYPLRTTYKSLDVILQGLSSIQCFGWCTDPILEKKYRSKALLIGTFKDEYMKSECKKSEDDIDHELRSELQQAKVITVVCQQSDSRRLFYSLDNMNGDLDEINNLCKLLMKIIDHEGFYPEYPIPAKWLIFRMIIHLMHKSIVTRDECKEIAKRLNMQNSDLETALWFYSKKVGSLMYFNDSDVPSMGNKIICSPQVIFDSISEIMIDNNILHPCSGGKNDFSFTLSDFKKFTDSDLEKKLLRTEELIEILEHFGIVAEVPLTQRETHEASEYACTSPKYIIPAMLQSASDSDLEPRDMKPEEISYPLLIEFECGHVPLGIFCTVIAHIIRYEKEWQLVLENVRKQKFIFRMKKTFDVILVAKPKYLQVQVVNLGCCRTLREACNNVRRTLSDRLEGSLRGIKSPFHFSNSTTKFYFSFLCTCTEGNKHLMRVEKGQHMPTQAECGKNPEAPTERELTNAQKHWFEYVS